MGPEEGVRERFARASVAVVDRSLAGLSERDAFWTREGQDRFELCVNGRVAAVASLTPNAVFVGQEAMQAQNFPVLDSETIFDAAERRLGIGQVTEYRPLHLREMRKQLEVHAEEFRRLCPMEHEPRHYLARAVESLKRSPYAAVSTSGVMQAQRHLEAALTELDRRSGRPSVLVDMHHRAAFDELERAKGPRYLTEELAMGDCVRAQMAFNRNRVPGRTELERSALAVPGLVYHRTR